MSDWEIDFERNRWKYNDRMRLAWVDGTPLEAVCSLIVVTRSGRNQDAFVRMRLPSIDPVYIPNPRSELTVTRSQIERREVWDSLQRNSGVRKELQKRPGDLELFLNREALFSYIYLLYGDLVP
jgi:hypothetical protein